ncbi:MAG: AI-2E family transporter [Gemmatimonadetes bacterium]|nr:AI-2E family transporter [Gemmatimonadota bacterium]
MASPVYPEADRRFIQLSVEASIRIGLLALLTLWALNIVRPFIEPVLWGVIIAVAVMPIHQKVAKRLGGRPKLAATLFALLALAALIIPTVQFFGDVVSEGRALAQGLESGTLQVPPAPDKVRDWPVIGDPLADVWTAASQDLEGTLKKYQSQVAAVGSRLAAALGGLAMTVLQFIISFIVAAVFLVSASAGKDAVIQFATKVAGQDGAAFVRLSELTIRSVAQGILGIAVIQALLSGLGLAVAGVPGASLWAMVVLFLAIMQLPPILVLGPAMVYVFGNASPTTAVIFMIYGIIVSGSDAILKPMLLGRGVDVPMLVILVGAIGGMMMSGIIGLFVGAVVLALFYQLLVAWIGDGGNLEGFEATAEAPAAEES